MSEIIDAQSRSVILQNLFEIFLFELYNLQYRIIVFNVMGEKYLFRCRFSINRLYFDE